MTHHQLVGHRSHHSHPGATGPGPATHRDPDTPSLSRTAFRATLHCLTGCAVGEVLGMAIGTALGWADAATIALAVGLAFLFGYGLTILPLRRAGLALSVAVPLAFAADSLSIAVMEIVDNGVMLAVPGAMGSGVDTPVFWGALAFALVVAFAVAFPVNRALIARGRGHAAVHAHHGDGGLPAPTPPEQGRSAFVLLGAGAVAVTLAVTVGGALLLDTGHAEPSAPPAHEAPAGSGH